MAAEKVIIFANQKGGVGKTLLSDELCFYFDRNNISYSLFDMDGQGGRVHTPHKDENRQVFVIDTPGNLTDDTSSIFRNGNLFIVPLVPSSRDYVPLLTTLSMIKKHAGEKAKIIFVFNRSSRFTSGKYFEKKFRNMLDSEYPEYSNSPILKLSSSEALDQAGMVGQSVVGYNRWSKGAKEIESIMETIMHYLKEED